MIISWSVVRYILICKNFHISKLIEYFNMGLLINLKEEEKDETDNDNESVDEYNRDEVT